MRSMVFTGAVAALTLFSAPASAQFTGVVVAPKTSVVAADTTPRTLAERRDSVAQVSLTSMKDWVDSAATALGVVAPPTVIDTAAPSARVEAVLPTPVAPDAPRATTEFREGAPAPNTATPIPMLALAGLGALGSGLWLLRRRRA